MRQSIIPRVDPVTTMDHGHDDNGNQSVQYQQSQALIFRLKRRHDELTTKASSHLLINHHLRHHMQALLTHQTSSHDASLLLQQTLRMTMKQIQHSPLLKEEEEEGQQNNKDSEDQSSMNTVVTREKNYYENRRTDHEELLHTFQELNSAHRIQTQKSIESIKNQELLQRLNQLDEQISLERDAVMIAHSRERISDLEESEEDNVADSRVNDSETIDRKDTSMNDIKKNKKGVRSQKKKRKKGTKGDGLSIVPLPNGYFVVQ